MEFLDPETDPRAQRDWARSVLAHRAWWLGELSGVAVLRRAAWILGKPAVLATERYIQEHAPPHARD